MAQRSQDSVEHQVQLFAHIFRKEAQHQIAILPKQLVFAPVAAVSDWIGEMLCAIELHGDTSIRFQQIDLYCSETIERNRHPGGARGASLGVDSVSMVMGSSVNRGGAAGIPSIGGARSI